MAPTHVRLNQLRRPSGCCFSSEAVVVRPIQGVPPFCAGISRAKRIPA